MLSGRYFIFLVLVFFALRLPAQTIPVGNPALEAKYSFIRTVFNRIQNSSALDSFYQKLQQLKQGGSGTVSIVHIGDSHIQPDFLSSVVRSGLQDFFGNAGRGLVFPYQLAQSNSPDDISSSSSIRWQFNRVAHPEIPLTYGVSGYGISTSSNEADIRFAMRGAGILQPFNRIKLFASAVDSADETLSWQLSIDDTLGSVVTKAQAYPFTIVELPKPVSAFRLYAPGNNGKKEVYGFSLENGSAGVLYHSIGVNGARYDQFNIAPLFWKQLPALEADLYIISLGTNEAQRAGFPEAVFRKELDVFIEKLRQASPGASILITTAPDSYKGRGSNRVLQQLNHSLVDYCNKNYIPVWDLYQITNGYGSAYSWARRGLMSRDRIHFTAQAYRLMGSLLFSALASGYNERLADQQKPAP